jgi:hypothetical protein
MLQPELPRPPSTIEPTADLHAAVDRELHAIAAGMLRGERSGHTLHSTAPGALGCHARELLCRDWHRSVRIRLVRRHEWRRHAPAPAAQLVTVANQPRRCG